MKTVTTIDELRAWVTAHRREGRRIGLVPTMGFLHEGHLSLIDAAREACDVVVVSIFVNPTQFGPHEDFDAYPRDTRRDLALCEKRGTDLVFLPAVQEVYPSKPRTGIHIGLVSEGLCGAARPGHFDGVALVVAKLFNMTQPDVAYFGQKDFQQTLVIQQMVRDLNVPVEIRVCPTVREADGLAMSSRNAYLTPGERKVATALSQALRSACDAFGRGVKNAADLRETALDYLRQEPSIHLEYLEIVGGGDARPVTTAAAQDVIAVAARVGKTRLIDNMTLGPER